MSSVGKGAVIGGVCGYLLVTLALGIFTKGNLSGLVGLMTGLPLGMAVGIIAAVAQSHERNRIETVLWISISVALIALVGIVGTIMLVNAKNG